MKTLDTQRSICGELMVTETRRDGQSKVVFREHNLVVENATRIIRDMIFNGGSGTVESVKKMQFGDCKMDPKGNVSTVDQPKSSDTSLINKVYEKDISQALTTKDGKPSITYTVTLGYDECNGGGTQLITEYGLSTSTGKLFARKTRAGIFKSTETSLDFTWTVVFS